MIIYGYGPLRQQLDPEKEKQLRAAVAAKGYDIMSRPMSHPDYDATSAYKDQCDRSGCPGCSTLNSDIDVTSAQGGRCDINLCLHYFMPLPPPVQEYPP